MQAERLIEDLKHEKRHVLPSRIISPASEIVIVMVVIYQVYLKGYRE
jgi:hypothetical protein